MIALFRDWAMNFTPCLYLHELCPTGETGPFASFAIDLRLASWPLHGRDQSGTGSTGFSQGHATGENFPFPRKTGAVRCDRQAMPACEYRRADNSRPMK